MPTTSDDDSAANARHSSTLSSTTFTMARAFFKNSLPVGDSSNAPPRFTVSGAPTSSSSAWIWARNVGCETNSSADAWA